MATRSLQRICVFCGSSTGTRAECRGAAEHAGRTLASASIGVVYGGGNVGLMGVVADAALEAGGTVIGVIPQNLVDRELAHRGLTQLHIVGSMHERKALMADLSDAFVALPGGFGTFEEFWEVVTWTQLGLHRKPCGLLNVSGFYDPMLKQVDRAIAEGFIRKENRALIAASDSVTELLQLLRDADVPHVPKWIDRATT